MVEVALSAEAVRELEALSNPIHGRVLKLLVRLQQWPLVGGAKPLTAGLAGFGRAITVFSFASRGMS